MRNWNGEKIIPCQNYDFKNRPNYIIAPDKNITMVHQNIFGHKIHPHLSQLFVLMRSPLPYSSPKKTMLCSASSISCKLDKE